MLTNKFILFLQGLLRHALKSAKVSIKIKYKKSVNPLNEITKIPQQIPLEVPF